MWTIWSSSFKEMWMQRIHFQPTKKKKNNKIGKHIRIKLIPNHDSLRNQKKNTCRYSTQDRHRHGFHRARLMWTLLFPLSLPPSLMSTMPSLARFTRREKSMGTTLRFIMVVKPMQQNPTPTPIMLMIWLECTYPFTKTNEKQGKHKWRTLLREHEPIRRPKL